MDNGRSMKLSVHLAFGGNCQEAFEFYERCFRGKIQFMETWGKSPMAAQATPEWHGKIMHATLEIGDGILYGADVPPGQYQTPSGFYMMLAIQDPAESQRIFQALAEKGTVQMPLEKTFWAVLFGVVTDRFGIAWEINCEAA